MMKERFEKTDLILAYAESQRSDGYEVLKEYYTALSDALQNAFRVKMMQDEIQSFDGKLFFMLFGQSIRDHLRLTANDGWLEAGLLEMKISKLGATGSEINRKRKELYDLREHSIQTNSGLLNDVFDLIWQLEKPFVTKDELQQSGFNLEKPDPYTED
jgi:hypothetical protein